MGNVLFGVDIAGIVADVIGEGVPAVTITRYTRGARDPANLTGGRAISDPVTVECNGFWEDFTSTPAGIELQLNDRKLVLIGDTVPAGGLPNYNDQATVHEDEGDVSLYVVQLVHRDPAAATYSYLCRDRRGPDGA